MILGIRRKARNLINLRRPCSSKNQRDSVKQEPRSEGPEQKILDGSFRTAAGIFAIAGKNVGGYR